MVRLCCLVLLICSLSPAWGQALRDPTAPSPRVRAALDPSGNRPPAMPGLPSQWIPHVTLKARLVLPGKPAVALIQVDKQLYLVRQGSELNLLGDRGGMVVLQVEAVDRSEVRILMHPLNQLLTLR